MTPKQIRQINDIKEHYGDEHQLEKAIEECEELIDAIRKHQGSFTNCFVVDIIDEIADVTVMIEQLKLILDCHGAVEDRIEYKINRQLERMKRGE